MQYSTMRSDRDEVIVQFCDDETENITLSVKMSLNDAKSLGTDLILQANIKEVIRG